MVNSTSSYNNLYAYQIFISDFDRFERFGVNALRVLYLLTAISHIQHRNNRWIPDPTDYRWVKLSNSLWKKDPSNKMKILRKLERAGLILIKNQKGKSKKSNPLVRLRDQKKQRTKVLEFGHGYKQSQGQSTADRGFKFSKLVGKLRSKKYGQEEK